MRGVYVLFMNMARPRTIGVGRLGTVSFEPGQYAYVGSAMNGLIPRVRRHLSGGDHTHWHIDYFRGHVSFAGVYLVETALRLECTLARVFNASGCPGTVTGFGSSDCSCTGHLFYQKSSAGINLADIPDDYLVKAGFCEKPIMIDDASFGALSFVRWFGVDCEHGNLGFNGGVNDGS